jgi:membrane protein
MAPLIATVRASFPVRLAQAYGKAGAGYFAGTLAFNMFISMFPLILGMLSVLGLLLRDPALQRQVETSVAGFFPSDARPSLLAAMATVREHSGLLGLVGIAGMLWSGSNLFVAMEFVLDRIFGAEDRGFLRKRAMALLMTVLFTVAVVVTVFVNAVMALLGNLPWLGAVTGAAVWVLFLLVLYRIVPNRTFRLSQMWGGALLAGGPDGGAHPLLALLYGALAQLQPRRWRCRHGSRQRSPAPRPPPPERGPPGADQRRG